MCILESGVRREVDLLFDRYTKPKSFWMLGDAATVFER